MRAAGRRADPEHERWSYPYAAPAALLRPARRRRTRRLAAGRDRTSAARTPLLAYGSNAAPEALARKLARCRRSRVAGAAGRAATTSTSSTRRTSPPTARCRRRCQRSPGDGEPVVVVHPDRRAADAAHGDRAELRARRLRITCGSRTVSALSELAAYVSRHGCLLGRRLAGRALAGGAHAGRTCRAVEPQLDRARLAASSSALPSAGGSLTVACARSGHPAFGSAALRSDGAKRRRARRASSRRRRRGSPGGASGPPIPGPAESSAAVIASSAGLKGKRAATTLIAS